MKGVHDYYTEVCMLEEFMDHVYLKHLLSSVDRYPWLTPSIDTFDQPSIDNQLILDWHSICISVYTRSALHRPLGWQSTNFRLMHTSWLTMDRRLIKFWLSVNWVSIGVLIECWLRCWLKVSIDTRWRMPLVHMIQIYHLIFVWLEGCLISVRIFPSTEMLANC